MFRDGKAVQDLVFRIRGSAFRFWGFEVWDSI